MRGACVVEAGCATNTEFNFAFEYMNIADDLVCPFLRWATDGHEIGNFGDALLGQESCDQDVGVRQIDLLGAHRCDLRSDFKTAAFFLIEQGREYRGRIEVGKTVEIDSSVGADEGGGLHVSDDAVLFDKGSALGHAG